MRKNRAERFRIGLFDAPTFKLDLQADDGSCGAGCDLGSSRRMVGSPGLGLVADLAKRRRFFPKAKVFAGIRHRGTRVRVPCSWSWGPSWRTEDQNRNVGPAGCCLSGSFHILAGAHHCIQDQAISPVTHPLRHGPHRSSCRNATDKRGREGPLASDRGSGLAVGNA